MNNIKFKASYRLEVSHYPLQGISAGSLTWLRWTAQSVVPESALTLMAGGLPLQRVCRVLLKESSYENRTAVVFGKTGVPWVVFQSGLLGTILPGYCVSRMSWHVHRLLVGKGRERLCNIGMVEEIDKIIIVTTSY